MKITKAGTVTIQATGQIDMVDFDFDGQQGKGQSAVDAVIDWAIKMLIEKRIGIPIHEEP